MSTQPTLPDLENDELVYRFENSGDRKYLNTVYDIQRSINGGKHEWIGTVYKVSDGDWQRSAQWTAVSRDGQISVSGDSRQKATRSLEYRLQGPDYHERRMAAYHAERAAQDAQREAQREADVATVDALAAKLTNSATNSTGKAAELLMAMREAAAAGRFNSQVLTPTQVVEVLNYLVTP